VGGSIVTLNVRVHNDGPGAKNGSIVRAYYTDPRVSLEFPNPVAVLIGEQTVNLPPGDTTVNFSWTVPTGTNSWGEHHWCVGAIAMHADDRPLTTQIQLSSNIGGRNFNTVDAIAGDQTLFVAITNFLGVAAEYDVVVNKHGLPPGWEVVAPPLVGRRKINRKALLLKVEGPVLEPGDTIIQPLRLRIPKTARPGARALVQVNGIMKPLVAGRRVPIGNGYAFDVRVQRASSNQ
jgi:hypothetical protein